MGSPGKQSGYSRQNKIASFLGLWHRVCLLIHGADEQLEALDGFSTMVRQQVPELVQYGDPVLLRGLSREQRVKEIRASQPGRPRPVWVWGS